MLKQILKPLAQAFNLERSAKKCDKTQRVGLQMEPFLLDNCFSVVVVVVVVVVLRHLCSLSSS